MLHTTALLPDTSTHSSGTLLVSVTNLKKQKRCRSIHSQKSGYALTGTFSSQTFYVTHEHAHKYKPQQASYKTLGSSVMCTLPNEAEESMCVVKVNGLLSGGQSHCSCSTAQKDSTTQTQQGELKTIKRRQTVSYTPL